ncbi:MAG TPA: hypothetical protein VFU54_07180 [Actinomycetota bacterium]|nr:hypothetical protein [Actinomycetota bacterium]
MAQPDAEAEMVRVSLANLGASLFQADWRRDVERIAPAMTDSPWWWPWSASATA